MTYSKTKIQGLFLFTPTVLEDSRGHFFESFRPDTLLDETRMQFKLAQVNNSLSNKGVLRGIHFKQDPPGQAKMVSVMSGSIIDVAIDLRKSSPTFGAWEAFELNAASNNSLFLGRGLGHAFLALEDNTRVSYLCDSVFEPDKEHSVNPLEAGIDWAKLSKDRAIPEFHMSDKDSSAPKLADATHLLFK